MAARVTPLPDYLRGGAFIPMQVAGDRDTFRPTPLAPGRAPDLLALTLAALAAGALAWALQRWRR